MSQHPIVSLKCKVMNRIENEEMNCIEKEFIDNEELVNNLTDEDSGWRLTPKSCLGIAIKNTEISNVDLFQEDEESRKFESVYAILEKRMYEAGYITDEDGKTKDNADSDKPIVIFTKTIKGFYPKATDEQISAAWDLFVFHMERQGNTRKREPTPTSSF